MIVLHVGDVVGKPGRKTVRRFMPELIDEYQPDLIIINGENVAGGIGITASTAGELMAAGAGCIATGNHVWAQKPALQLLDEDRDILRPANYPPGVPGTGAGLFEARSMSGLQVGVINLLGRVFMHEMDCPFRVADEQIEALKEHTNIIVVDFHAEATSEKQAFARYVDGRVSAVIGTHTHVQTADEQILPGGTAFIADVGMTGARESIIGVEMESVLHRFLTQLPQRFKPPTDGPGFLCAVVVEVDESSGQALRIERLRRDMD